ncbi:hypothetical protein BS329_09620 [Amycolatopsis coloradensis]|uniref:Uncharacterized protein n=1 Tax=Amycolatopsis coloradensis TaxID=76021 RepID=A0A1R0KVP0_9PSEU|nr:hypothetical protein BS329_09620 [Amycolatopsis coloradensis]
MVPLISLSTRKGSRLVLVLAEPENTISSAARLLGVSCQAIYGYASELARNSRRPQAVRRATEVAGDDDQKFGGCS